MDIYVDRLDTVSSLCALRLQAVRVQERRKNILNHQNHRHYGWTKCFRINDFLLLLQFPA